MDRHILRCLILLMAAARPLAAEGPSADEDLTTIRRDMQSGFAHAGWKYDRYSRMQSLDAGKRMVVADIKGPAIIRHIHTCRHQNPQVNARGIVLEIWFDDADKPAVCCPLADFFGDGCGGRSAYFSSKFIECAPWSYNGYFPMPFAKRARVILRNDTARDVMNYSYVEFEPLKEWKKDTGYFHATYRRRSFQLTKDMRETFFQVRGAGHVLGRQFSIVTSEPIFRDFQYVMEGNNEIDIDGRERALDYLGTEDSFTFSWGFQAVFTGLRAGMPLVRKGSENLLSIYRFHDHMPIRFARSLDWSINWRHEKMFTSRPEWAKRAGEGGCRVDYATVFYWYQDSPAGFEHEPLPPAEQRSAGGPDAEPLDELVASARLDQDLVLTLDRKEDLARLTIANCWAGTHPFWIDQPAAKGGHPGNPNPGRRGALALHGASEHAPALVVRKVALPGDRPCKLRVVVSGDPYEAPDRSDFVVSVGVHDGGKTAWLKTETIDAGSRPSPDNWRTLEISLKEYAGRTVGLVVRAAYGGKKGVMNEEAFLDEMSVLAE